LRGHHPQDRHLCFLSFAHFAEQFMSIYLALVAGYRVVATGARDLLSSLAAARPTFVMAVPSQWQEIAAALAAGRAPAQLGLADLRLALGTGAMLAAGVQQQLAAAGIVVHEMYGMTETTGAAVYNHPDSFRAGSVGRALPGSHVRVDPDGEVWIDAGPCRSPGYLDDPDETAATFAPPWVRTGDLGRLDADGYLYLFGRKKSILVLSTGKKAQPAPIEAQLEALPGVRHAVVVGDGRPFLVALLDADVDARASIEAALVQLNASSVSHERVRSFAFIAPLSSADGTLTTSLKVQRDAVLRRSLGQVDALYAEARRS
jgi:long-chain acyl-CoA synthetase